MDELTNAFVVRKLTTLLARALEKSGEVYTVNELVLALEVLKQNAIEIGSRGNERRTGPADKDKTKP